jgi:hypothetical protein
MNLEENHPRQPSCLSETHLLIRREKPRQGLANCSIILKKRGYSNENITSGFRNADLAQSLVCMWIFQF